MNNCTPWYLPNELETYVFVKYLHPNVYSIFILNHQTWKQPRCPSVREWTGKLVHPDNGILLRDKKGGAIKPQKEVEKAKCLLLSERNQSEKVMWCMIPTIWLSGKGKTRQTVKIPVISSFRFRGCMREQEGRKGELGFLGHWNYSVWYYSGGYMPVCICQKPTKLKNTKSEP